MRDPFPCLDFGSLTAEPAGGARGYPQALAFGSRMALRPSPMDNPCQFSDTATGEKDERPGGAQNRCERDLDAGRQRARKSHGVGVSMEGEGLFAFLE